MPPTRLGAPSLHAPYSRSAPRKRRANAHTLGAQDAKKGEGALDPGGLHADLHPSKIDFVDWLVSYF